MIIDKLLEFADAATVGVTAATVYPSDIVDLGASPTLKNIGNGDPLYLVINIDTAVTSGAGCNVTFKLVSDSTSNLTTSPTTHYTSGAIAKATLIAGYQVCCIPLPTDATYERYLGVTTTPDTTDTTAGKYNAFLTATPPAWYALPDAL